jgi:maltose alpha-D-glucosyltransferase/alpha-amylase
MHLALSIPSDDPRFAPEPVSDADVAAAVGGAQARAERTLANLEATLGIAASQVLPDVVRDARTLLAARDHLLTALRSAAEIGPLATKVRIHGDYRLGQVLLAEGDVYIQNVEGHLSWPAAAQREKLSVLRDVAGMLRSFSYAGHVALRTRATTQSDQIAHLTRWAQTWEAYTASAFLQSYFATGGAASALPADTVARAGYLRFFMIDRAVRELDGELNNRVEWIGIPISGLLDLLALR